MEEIWKVKEGYSKYQISNLGRIRVISNKNIVKYKTNNNGYYLCYLYSDNFKCNKPIYPHIVVAELFVKNPNNFPKVKHIDGNKCNNRYNNLVWFRSNGELNYKTKKIYSIDDIDSEIWSKIPGFDEIYEVSNFGRVRNLNYCGTHNIGFMTQRLDRYGYYKVSIKDKLKSVHQLVAMAFLGHVPDGTMNFVVNHKDSNRTNNRVENLEIVTHRYNIYHGAKKRDSSSKYVGVSLLHGYKNKWISGICINNKTYNLGVYKSEDEAGLIYEKAKYALENNCFDEFYKENFSENPDKDMFTSEDFTSKYRGVNLHPKTNRWISSIGRNGTTYRLGQYDNEYDAHLEFKRAEKAYNDGSFEDYLKQLKPINNKTSDYRGIYFDKTSNKWNVSINYNKESKHLGSCDTEEECYQIYQDAELAIKNNEFEEFLKNIKHRHLIPCEYENIFYNTKNSTWVVIENGIRNYYKTKEKAYKQRPKTQRFN